MSGWQPQQYDPPQHQQRVTAPQPQGQPWPPQYGQYPQQPPYAPAPAAPPRKRRRVFMWIFLAVQIIFVAWIAAGLASHPAGPSAAAQAAQQCANGGWRGLFTSQADCRQHYAVALNDAGNAGKGIGVAIIFVFWCVVDFLMGVTYLIIRLSRRS